MRGEPPRIWNKKKEKPPREAVYIGRGSPWGNPFTVADYGRGKALEAYKNWIWEPEQEPLRRRMVQELRDKDLVCFCAPQPCHGEIVRHIASGPCFNCCNGAVLLNDTNDPDKAEFGTCPVCKGDSRQ